MIRKIEMYQAVCDRCGKSYVNEDLGYCAWVDVESARENALESDTGWQEIDGRIYCPDCIEFDEEIDDYKLKEERK